MKQSLCVEDKISERTDERQLCALYDISAVINSSDGIDERMGRVLTEAMRAVGSQAAGIALRSGNRWAVRYARNAPSDLIGRSFSDEEFSHAAAAMKTKMPVTIGDVFADNRANAAFMKAYDIRSVLAVPLGIGTGGCLFFHYPASKETFDPIEVDFAERTAGLVSLALRNARHAEERERLIEQVEKERGRLEVLLKEIPAGVIIAEVPSGKVIQSNEQAERILRQPVLKAAGADDLAYRGFHPDGRPYLPEEWPLARSILNREAVVGEEIRILRGDGSEGAINVSAAPLFDNQERVIAGITVFYDITGLRQIEELRAHWAALVESSGEAIISITKDLSGLIRTWNKGAETIFGYSADEVIGRNISLLVPPDVPNDIPSILERIKRGERINRYETLRMRKDGVRIYVSLNISPIRDAGGRIIGASTIAVDINRRRLAEEALKDSESKFRNIASAAQDAVILIDNEGTVGFWNDAATKIFGYSSEEMMGTRLHSLIMPERYREEHIRGFEAFRVTGQGRFIGTTYQIAAKRKDGTEFPIELSLAALKLKDKWNAIGIVRDITERKRAEEELKRVVDELEHSNKELEQFAYVASHDLQEPLRTVSSYVELLEMRYKGKLDENADKYIYYAIEGTNRMATLINDLLAYSRVGTQGKQFAKIEMEAVFQEAINNLKKAIQENGAAITSDELPVVTGDDTQLVQLLQNLIANAIKFRKKDMQSRVHISVVRKGDDWVFGVRDNGIGIEPRFYERIFMIFQRLHTKEEYPGTGVGLAICRRIVERHGGRIWVESRPGEGSTFYFTIPARD